MAVSEGVDLAGARVLLLSRLVKEGLESVADLRVAFDSVKEKRDLEVKGMFEEDTDPKLIESFSVFLDVEWREVSAVSGTARLLWGVTWWPRRWLARRKAGWLHVCPLGLKPFPATSGLISL